MKATHLLALAALLAAPLAFAQQTSDGSAPTASDMSATPPADDSSYAPDNLTAADVPPPLDPNDPSLSASDMNATPPSDDTSYLNDNSTPENVSVSTTPAEVVPTTGETTPPSGSLATSTPASTGASPTSPPPASPTKAPGFELVALAAAAGIVALTLRRKR